MNYLKQRWVFYQAANRGHIPTLVVRSKKGPKTVKITNWVEYVLYHAKQVDDLPIAIPNSTKTSTKTAVNNFNHFWSNAIFDPVQQPAICHLRNSFEQEDMGIMCLASMNHVERALTLAHYADKSTKLTAPDPCSGTSKYNYLHSIQRFLKAYEKFYELTDLYDTKNWSWAASLQYEIVRDTLKVATVQIQTKIPAEQRDKSTFHLSDNHFALLNAYTYRKAQSFYETNFPMYLSTMQHWFIQLLLVFICGRGVEEITFMEKRELKKISYNRLLYEPLQTLKNTTCDSHYRLVTKDPKEVISQEGVHFFELMITKCQTDFEGEERLFLRPSSSATPSSQYYFEKKVRGEHFIENAVSMYAKQLQKIDPSFPRHPKICNTSVRKCHTFILNTSLLPASVQKQSLGHTSGHGSNEYWRNNYNNPRDIGIRAQVAETVAQRVGIASTNLSPAKRSIQFVQSPPQSKRSVQFRSTPPTHNSRSVHAQSPQEFAVYKTGNIHFLNDDDDFKMQLPNGARVSINLPGGMNLRFKISK